MILQTIDSMLVNEGWAEDLAKKAQDTLQQGQIALDEAKAQAEAALKQAEELAKNGKAILAEMERFRINADRVYNELPNVLQVKFQKYMQAYITDFTRDSLLGKSPNGYVFDLINYFGEHPGAFYAAVIAIPTLLSALLISGGALIYKKVKDYQVSKSELETAKDKIDTAETEEEKKQAEKELGILGAKQLIFVKFNKA